MKRNIFSIFTRWVVALAALAFLVCCIVASETISNILHQVALAIWDNVVNTKLFIGIVAFVLGVAISSTYSAKKIKDLETKNHLLQKDLAYTVNELAKYHKQDEALCEELKAVEDNHFENGQKIIKEISNF